MIRVARHPRGRRVYVGPRRGLRVHHGTAGMLAAWVGAAVHSRALTIAGLTAMVHDARDFPWRDCDNH